MMASSQKFKILHLSDIHFGKTNEQVMNLIPKESIDLLILTGDLTQRAKKSQFKDALEFLKRFTCPVFLIPGNHDVPLYNLFLRLFFPYYKFRKAMGLFTADFYQNDRVAVVGLWTQNRFTVKSGKLYSKQLMKAAEQLSGVDPQKLKIVAAHHPLTTIDLGEGQPRLKRLIEMGPDLMMWGHDHQSSAEYLDRETSSGPVVLAAGTGFSSRTREETNSYNLITLEGDSIQVEIFNFNPDTSQFEVHQTKSFIKRAAQKPVSSSPNL